MSRGVLLIGSSSPIGLAIAARFARDGDRVVGVGVDPAGSANLGDLTEYLAIDVSTATGAEEAVRGTLAALGRLDVLVLAAAVMRVAPAHLTSEEDWNQAVRNTLDTAFYPTRATLPHLPLGGAIVAVSSVNASLAAPSLPGYAAAKAGVEGLVRQVALDYGPAGIRANAVAPGMIGNEQLPRVHEGYPLARVGRPEEVADAVHFLAGAGFVTGVVLPVDGGLSIASPAAYLRPDLRARLVTRESLADDATDGRS